MRRFVLVLALIGCETKKEPAAAAPSSATAATSAIYPISSCGDEVITDEGIGQLRIGTTVESIRQKCNVARDTTVIAGEGMPARKLAVAFSRDTVEAEIVNGRVRRIAVLSPRLRTAASLGVGTRGVRLLELKDAHGMMGEGELFVASPDHCGMSFRLANAGPGGHRGDLDRAGLGRLPVQTVVSEVLIFGCHLAPVPTRAVPERKPPELAYVVVAPEISEETPVVERRLSLAAGRPTFLRNDTLYAAADDLVPILSPGARVSLSDSVVVVNGRGLPVTGLEQNGAVYVPVKEFARQFGAYTRVNEVDGSATIWPRDALVYWKEHGPANAPVLMEAAAEGLIPPPSRRKQP